MTSPGSDIIERLPAQSQGLVIALQTIRLWLATENCMEPLEVADDALRAAGVTKVTCPDCGGFGEWDEGPLPATSPTQISPDYRQVKCPECDGTGHQSLRARAAQGAE